MLDRPEGGVQTKEGLHEHSESGLRPEQGRPELRQARRQADSYDSWWHHLDSTWLIKTNRSAVQVRDELKPLIDSNDELLVIEVTSDSAAWFGFNDKGSK